MVLICESFRGLPPLHVLRILDYKIELFGFIGNCTKTIDFLLKILDVLFEKAILVACKDKFMLTSKIGEMCAVYNSYHENKNFIAKCEFQKTTDYKDVFRGFLFWPYRRRYIVVCACIYIEVEI